jgi:hypothetical protein
MRIQRHRATSDSRPSRLPSRAERVASGGSISSVALSGSPPLPLRLPLHLVQARNEEGTWLVREAKVRDLQNRLGFVVSLAKVQEDTLCEALMSARMREAVRDTRSSAAAHCNLLTGWKLEHLRHDP